MVKIDVFIIGTITSIFLYLSIPVYYRIERLKFLHRPSYRDICGILSLFFLLCFGYFYEIFHSFKFLTEFGLLVHLKGQPEVQTWTGELVLITEIVTRLVPVQPIDTIVATESIGLWLIALLELLFHIGSIINPFVN